MKMTKQQAGKLGSIKLIENLHKRYNENPSFCSGCNNELEYKKRHNKYCSRKCSRRYSGAGKKSTDSSVKNLHERKCELCGKYYTTKHKKSKFCSHQCSARNRIEQGFLMIDMGEQVSSTIMKNYLIEKYGERCLDSNCAWDFSKRPIGIELEHIDGNSENNILKNCTLLCPNCHSQTLTYKARNTGNGRYKRRQRYSNNMSY